MKLALLDKNDNIDGYYALITIVLDNIYTNIYFN